MHTESMMVTPEMATAWLAKNTRNRAINADRVKLYAEEMKKGNWLPHHQGVAFYEDGTFADGQHRLCAVVKSGVTVPMVVTNGVPLTSGLVMDAQQPRHVHQSIAISGAADWVGRNEVAVINMFSAMQDSHYTKLSAAGVLALGERYKSSILFATATLKTHKQYVSTSSVGAAVGAASKHVDKGRLLEFVAVLFTGMPKGKQDKAAVLARDFLIVNGGKTGFQYRLGAVRRVMRAVRAFCDYEPIGRLYEPEDFLFPPVPDN